MTTLPLMDSPLLYSAPSGLVQIARADDKSAPRELIPSRPLEAGEQYRFHFDMTKCIGCKCCVVACNEQNGNPADLNWRRVGEVEGGYYPLTQRHYLSMGCNHCIEPSCLIGCPVEAYTKDPATGVVVHSAEACIGCQYCTWNCSYGVPQYNPARGVVGKCDMCHNRLSDNMAPACVNACPEGAIAIEIVNIADWRRDYLSANAPGLPSADDSISTTRVTLPENLVPDLGRVDTNRVEPEHPHWPLVFMLVVTQLCVGAFIALWLLDAVGAGTDLKIAALASLALAGMSLGASTMHLGRPIHAWRAMRGLRRSWLSREVLTLSMFAGAAGVFAGLLFFGSPGFFAPGSSVPRLAAGLATALAGLAGITCSARIYIVRARPAWFSSYTVAEFFSTALLLGPAFVHMLDPRVPSAVLYASVAGGAAQLIAQAGKFLWLSQSEVFELRSSSLLLAGKLRALFVTRLAILVAAGIVIPMAATAPLLVSAAFAAAFAGELLGRYLFFVSVVPKNIAAGFSSARRAA
ncbi:MAG TPA: DmsC/YnfH family molybdoenzyme membrane anchor subunit [Bryobacteraceae bacterium]|nr:DmsC/YnfH family molybdoenzyme membrane anchor subunit [Bryobacteraceae bacterium]